MVGSGLLQFGAQLTDLALEFILVNYIDASVWQNDAFEVLHVALKFAGLPIEREHSHATICGRNRLNGSNSDMSPVGGQGINIALRDAVVAANHLAPVLRDSGSSDAIDAAALGIGLERAPEVVFIQALQARPPRVIMARTWWAQVLLELPKLLRFAPVRGLAIRIARPMLFGTTDVVLRV